MISCGLRKIIPKLEVSNPEMFLRLEDFDANGYLRSDRDESNKEGAGKMVQVDCKYNNGEVMCSGWGNTRK